MEEMKWFGSALLNVLAASNVGCGGLALAEICLTFWQAAVPRRHGVKKISYTEPS